MDTEYYLSGMHAGINTEELHALINHICKGEGEADIVWHYVANLLQKKYFEGYKVGKEKGIDIMVKRCADMGIRFIN